MGTSTKHLAKPPIPPPQIGIADEGIGIGDSNLAHIFDRFHTAMDSSHESTGLGLAIVTEIANRHEIDIQVESAVGEGTIFRFVFPMA